MSTAAHDVSDRTAPLQRASLRRRRSAFRALTRGVAGLSLLLIVVLWTFVFVHVGAREELERNASQQTYSNLTRAFAEHVSHSVREIDAKLLLLRTVIAAQGESFRLADYTDSDYFKNELILQVTRVDASGLVLDSNLGAPAEPVDLSDRAHIRVHMSNDGKTPPDRLFISEPVLGRISKKWSIQFTRPLLPIGTKGGGVLIASVNPHSISNYYKSFDLGAGAITLVGSVDGIVRARGSGGSESFIGRRLAEADQLLAIAEGPGCRVMVSSLDAIRKLFCFRKVPDADLFVMVGIPETQLTVELVQSRRRFFILATLVTALCAPMIGSAAVRRYNVDAAQARLERAQLRAAAAARDLRCALDNMSHGIMLLDSDGAVVVSNDRADSLLALRHRQRDSLCSNAEILEKIADVERAEDSDLSGLRSALQLDHRRASVACAGPQGRMLEVCTRRLSDGGFVRTIEDVTLRYRDARLLAEARDEAQAASKARALFLARMSHEIRTPLHATTGFARILAKRQLDPEVAKLVSLINESSSHLIAIVDDILDLSSVDSGRLRLVASPFELRAMLERLKPIARSLIGERPICFNLEADDDLPDWIVGDERRLFQVLVNLVTNAVKFTDSGDVTVRVRALVNAAGSATLLHVETADTGCGITPETIETLFEPFHRGEHVGHKPGAGLGLSIVREFVGLMSGEIVVNSTPGAGTSVLFHIPVEIASPPRPAADMAANPVRTDQRSLDILVADDTRSGLMLIRMLLEHWGHRVSTVSDGQQAVEACSRRAFDLVLLDIQMPVMGGLEAAIRIRKGAADATAPFISALTAQVLKSDLQRAREAGMEAVLRKPLDEAELAEVLRRACERRLARRV